MKDYKLLRIWEVIYPIGIYFVVTNVVMFVLNLMHTMTNENYMIYQIIATVIAFPFIYAFYRKEDGGKMANLPRTILFAAAAGLFGVVLNNLIGYTSLKETSQSYQEVSVAFYGSTLALEILGTCIIIPFLEELLYRGIVYQRLKAFLGVKTAIVLSAVIFGAMHFNLVQFLYATGSHHGTGRAWRSHGSPYGNESGIGTSKRDKAVSFHGCIHDGKRHMHRGGERADSGVTGAGFPWWKREVKSG